MNTILIALLFFLIALNPSNTFSQNWQALGSGMNGNVYALCEFNNELIAGGNFTIAGGIAANYIARWNGTNWSPLGTGMNSPVHAVCVYNGQLIAGGAFTTAGGSNVNYIARWNGSSWQSLGTGANSYIVALTVFNNELVAGGAFSSIGGVSSLAIARWNGTQWLAFPAGVDNIVRALTVYNGELILGGEFLSPFRKVARWNGNIYLDLNWGTVGDVYSLTGGASYVVIGGAFNVAGNMGNMNCIAKWQTGSIWSQIGTGMNFMVTCGVFYNGNLISGGQFTTAGGNSSNRIAKWNNTAWLPLGFGLNASASALTVFRDELIAGGSFTNAGGVAANYIARWNDMVGINLAGNEIPRSFVLYPSYPNPFNPAAKIKFDIPVREYIIMSIYDIMGNEIENILSDELTPGSYEVEWDASRYASGTYYCKISAGQFAKTQKMVLIK